MRRFSDAAAAMGGADLHLARRAILTEGQGWMHQKGPHLATSDLSGLLVTPNRCDLMREMPLPGEDHGRPCSIDHFDRLRIPHGPTGLVAKTWWCGDEGPRRQPTMLRDILCAPVRRVNRWKAGEARAKRPGLIVSVRRHHKG